MLEPLVYGVALACFLFVIFATARMPHEMLLVVCIPAVFVALVMGFVMGIYAWDTYGGVLPLAALLPALVGARALPRRYGARDLLVAIYLVWAVGLVFAMIGVGMPDAE